jgi:hypothetical protein
MLDELYIRKAFATPPRRYGTLLRRFMRKMKASRVPTLRS